LIGGREFDFFFFFSLRSLEDLFPLEAIPPKGIPPHLPFLHMGLISGEISPLCSAVSDGLLPFSPNSPLAVLTRLRGSFFPLFPHPPFSFLWPFSSWFLFWHFFHASGPGLPPFFSGRQSTACPGWDCFFDSSVSLIFLFFQSRLPKSSFAPWGFLILSDHFSLNNHLFLVVSFSSDKSPNRGCRSMNPGRCCCRSPIVLLRFFF